MDNFFDDQFTTWQELGEHDNTYREMQIYRDRDIDIGVGSCLNFLYIDGFKGENMVV